MDLLDLFGNHFVPQRDAIYSDGFVDLLIQKTLFQVQLMANKGKACFILDVVLVSLTLMILLCS